MCWGYNNIYIDRHIRNHIKFLNLPMQCDCRSKDLYRNYDKLTFRIDGQEIPQTRRITKQEISPQNEKILRLMYENSSIYLPSTIDRIEAEEVYASPLWFYKNYIGLNKPCVITGAIEGQITEKWANPQDFKELTNEIPQVSVSITPDGFADSIKNQYFVQPLEVKKKIKDVINWKEKGSEERNWIPYIQHQNSNLTQELSGLQKSIDSSFKQFVSQRYFDGNEPDASNFWMGYRDSVSALHKDPYENFYTTITGQKHFTLLPPTSIAFLQEETYKSARYKIDSSKELSAFTDPNSPYETTRWINCNPDLLEDELAFPDLKQLKESNFHVILEAGETLYLPSLWYHQVSQTHHKCCYALAINYWFDMSFGPNYGLYETARRLKGYP